MDGSRGGAPYVSDDDAGSGFGPGRGRDRRGGTGAARGSTSALGSFAWRVPSLCSLRRRDDTKRKQREVFLSVRGVRSSLDSFACFFFPFFFFFMGGGVVAPHDARVLFFCHNATVVVVFRLLLQALFVVVVVGLGPAGGRYSMQPSLLAPTPASLSWGLPLRLVWNISCLLRSLSRVFSLK